MSGCLFGDTLPGLPQLAAPNDLKIRAVRRSKEIV